MSSGIYRGLILSRGDTPMFDERGGADRGVIAMSINRRQFLRGAAVSAAALAATPTLVSAESDLPSPDASQIEHIIVVMMENRSFDHFMGWLPGSKGTQAGLSYTDSSGESHPTYHLTDYVGCAHPDPDHSYAGGRSEYDGGKMDGWLRTTTNDVFCIGYYDEADVPVLSALARNAMRRTRLQTWRWH
jgi:phospholipase C